MYTSVVLKQTVAKKELELWLPSPTDLPMCSVHDASALAGLRQGGKVALAEET
jgi:hypothetical protein